MHTRPAQEIQVQQERARKAEIERQEAVARAEAERQKAEIARQATRAAYLKAKEEAAQKAADPGFQLALVCMKFDLFLQESFKRVCLYILERVWSCYVSCHERKMFATLFLNSNKKESLP